MPYPTEKEIARALLAYMSHQGGKVRSNSTYRPLGNLFGLTDEEQNRSRGEHNGKYDHKQSIWHALVQYGRDRLRRDGYLGPTALRGVWRLSERGIQAAANLAPWSEMISKQDTRSTSSAKLPGFITYSTEKLADHQFVEGATREVKVNAYERNSKARTACLEHYGFDCAVCGFNFIKFYGEIGSEFIHVHHLTDLATIAEEYEVDPIKDLRPVCPNCHAMLHVDTPAMSISKLQSIIGDRGWCGATSPHKTMPQGAPNSPVLSPSGDSSQRDSRNAACQKPPTDPLPW
ncbi:MAG: winged helix-turn-helix domain-containing protein [Pirellulaceae bacterium]